MIVDQDYKIDSTLADRFSSMGKRQPIKPASIQRGPQAKKNLQIPQVQAAEDWTTFRLFPTSQPKSADGSLTTWLPSTDEWAEQVEACRGKFKKVSLGLLGVAPTKGPSNIKGFGAGRGIPVAC